MGGIKRDRQDSWMEKVAGALLQEEVNSEM